MWHDRRRMAAFLLLFGSIFGYEISRLFFVQHGTPRVSPARGRTTLIDDISGRREVAQTFRIDADGFDGISVHARPRRGDVAGDVVFELYDVVAGRDRLVYRVAHPAEEVVADQAFRLSFPSIVPSRGRHFRLRVRAPSTPAERPIALVAALTDEYDGGQLFVDGREQWGDLVFETSARYATVPWLLDQIMPLGPWWLRTWWFASALFLIWNTALAYACFLAIARANGARPEQARHTLDGTSRGTDRRADTHPRQAPMPVQLSRRRASAAKRWFAAVLVPLVGTAGWPTPNDEVINLLDRFSEARKETDLGQLHLAFALTPVTIRDERKPALLELPPSVATWRLQVPPEATFVADIGLAPHTWTMPTDGAIFIVEIIDRHRRSELARLELAPFIVPEQRRWFPVRLDLRPWAGRTVDFVLRTDPGRANNPVNDACVWGSPRIVAPRAPATRTTRGVWR
ncbi:MAG: hypothetical protein GEV06_24320 [Luteitalea sp.]|nr:hypothetical protein [Luteitalea sp.]